MTRKAIPFTRKNVLDLAKEIYNENGNTVTYMKLCDGMLENGTTGLRCGVGELLWRFTPNSYRKVVTSDKPNAYAQELLSKLANIASDVDRDEVEEIIGNLMEVNDDSEDLVERARNVSDSLVNDLAPFLK